MNYKVVGGKTLSGGATTNISRNAAVVVLACCRDEQRDPSRLKG